MLPSGDEPSCDDELVGITPTASPSSSSSDSDSDSSVRFSTSTLRPWLMMRPDMMRVAPQGDSGCCEGITRRAFRKVFAHTKLGQRK